MINDLANFLRLRYTDAIRTIWSFCTTWSFRKFSSLWNCIRTSM